MTRGRNRNRATEEYVAKKQINAIGGGLQLEELLKIIDAKDGDYYKAELSPREGWREAYDHFGMTGKRETLDLEGLLIIIHVSQTQKRKKDILFEFKNKLKDQD